MIARYLGGRHVTREGGKNLGRQFTTKSESAVRLGQVKFVKHDGSQIRNTVLDSRKGNTVFAEGRK